MENDPKKVAGSGAAPTFTPPTAPTFTPPAHRHDGPSCYYHHDEPAVAKCARCGKLICQDCFDNFGVTNDEYAGKALCYDCCKELVAANVQDLTRNKAKIKVQFILSLIGIGLGFILGMSEGISSGDIGAGFIAGLIFAAIGGVFLSALKVFGSMALEAIKIAFAGQFGVFTVISLIFNIIVVIFKCFWVTITNTIYYITYLKQTSGFIESDSAALRQMDEYMEYTMVRSQYQDIDLDTLLKQDSKLAENSYAQMVQAEGEEKAEATIRQCVARINENGEIIRSFEKAA